MMTDEAHPQLDIDPDLDVSKPEDEYEDFNRRSLLNPKVRKYMLAEGPHPNMLLPWEEVREALDGHAYFFDLVTNEVVLRPDAELDIPRPRQGAHARQQAGLPPGLQNSGPEAKETYFRRREMYVNFWRVYLRIRKNLFF